MRSVITDSEYGTLWTGSSLSLIIMDNHSLTGCRMGFVSLWRVCFEVVGSVCRIIFWRSDRTGWTPPQETSYFCTVLRNDRFLYRIKVLLSGWFHAILTQYESIELTVPCLFRFWSLLGSTWYLNSYPSLTIDNASKILGKEGVSVKSQEVVLWVGYEVPFFVSQVFGHAVGVLLFSSSSRHVLSSHDHSQPS